MPRGSLVSASLVPVSAMVQVSERVDSAMNGSMKAVAGSGMANMSEASIDFQPRMEEPSKPRPSLKESSFNSLKGRVKCCQVPKVSTNFTSTILAPAFLAISNACLGVLRVGSALFFIAFRLTNKNPGPRVHMRRGELIKQLALQFPLCGSGEHCRWN